MNDQLTQHDIDSPQLSQRNVIDDPDAGRYIPPDEFGEQMRAMKQRPDSTTRDG